MAVIRLLLLWLCFAAGFLRAQAPGTVSRADIDGVYRRPDLKAPLFEALHVPLGAGEAEAVRRDLQLLVRNFPESPWVNHRMRSRALALALRLYPDDRASLVAGGQLARGFSPPPIRVEVPATPQAIARRFLATGTGLLDEPETDARTFARLLLDLAGQLDSALLPLIFPLTYGATPDWHDEPAAMEPVETAPGLLLKEAGMRVLRPGFDHGQLRILTVKAEARPAGNGEELRFELPPPLLQAMAQKEGGEALTAEVNRRMDTLSRALRLRHEIWPSGWVVQLSATGPGAAAPAPVFAGMAVVMEAILSGEATDDGCLLAAEADPDGGLRGVMPLDQFLPAAALLQGGGMIVLPGNVATEMEDWLLLRPDQWPLLFQMPLHRAQSVTDIMALAKEERAPRLEQSLTQFSGVAARLRAAASPLAELRRAETLEQLRAVTAWHPHHLSAAALLSVAAGGPATFSPQGSLRRIDQTAACVLSTDRAAHPLHRRPPRLKKSEFGTASQQLKAEMKKLHPSVRSYAAEVDRLAVMLDRTAGFWDAYLKQGPPEPPAIQAQRAAVTARRRTLDAAGN